VTFVPTSAPRDTARNWRSPADSAGPAEADQEFDLVAVTGRSRGGLRNMVRSPVCVTHDGGDLEAAEVLFDPDASGKAKVRWIGTVQVQISAVRKDGPASTNGRKFPRRNRYFASTGNSQVTTGAGETLLSTPSGWTAAQVRCSSRNMPSASSDHRGVKRISMDAPAM